MENPEARILQSLTIDQAHKEALHVLAKDAIPLEEFSDLYGAKTIEEDAKYVAEMEEKFAAHGAPEQREALKLATILEAIIHEHAELSDWFGPDAYTIKPSRYDDIKNGVDSIVEIRETPNAASHLALAIDATFSGDTQKKFERIQKEIENGTLARVKYFRSEHINIRGELTKMPRVVIGADAKTVRELAEYWLENNKKALGAHPVQFQILEEIVLQLHAFEAYADKVRQPEAAARYVKARGLIEKILEEKKISLDDPGTRDNVFYAIESELRRFAV